MFDIGFSELVVIGFIALVVLGPKRLPEVARTAGRWLAQIRRFIADVKTDIDREIHNEELAELRKLKDELTDTRQLMHNTSSELLQGFVETASATTPPANPANEPAPLADTSNTQAVAATPPAKRPRVKFSKQTKSGKQHVGTPRTRRR
ncbi:MAG: Sec-independent protein translocase protein TatB [Sulfuricaulis sp.]